MREVGIHLEDEVILVLDSPFETSDIRGSKTLFSGTFNEEEFPLESRLDESFNDVGSAVGRAVVDDQNMELQRQLHDHFDDVFDVFFLVVSRNDN